MSDTTNNKPVKTYVDGLWLRERKFDDGGAILKVSVLAAKFTDFIKKHTKPDGFVNIVIAAKREPDEKNTHYAYLDTWQPASAAPANNQPKPVAKAATKPQAKTPAPVQESDAF